MTTATSTPRARASNWLGELLQPGRASLATLAKIAPAREERLFLLLSIFIGIIAGLLVVSFRMAIEWLSVLLLGSSPHPHQTRLLWMPALVGMGVLFAAFLRVPLTSVFMVLEMSGNYSIVLPVILANTIAYLFARALQPVPIFEVFTHQDGLDLPSMEVQREESNLRLEDAVEPVTAPVLQGSETVGDTLLALAHFENLRDIPTFLIHCPDGLWLSSRRQDLQDLLSKAPAEEPLCEQLGPERTPILFPDLPLASALPHFQRWPLLPITNRAMRGALEGAVSLEGVLKRYQQR